MIKRLIHDIFHFIPPIFPRLILGLIWGPWDDSGDDVEKGMLSTVLDIRLSDWCDSVSMV
jgi:hypothetical protein